MEMASGKLRFAVDVAIAAAGVAWVAASLWWDIRNDKVEWFQRSGSILVMLFVILELRQISVKKPKASTGVFTDGRPSLTDPEVPIHNHILHWISWIGIVLGTTIWGYGDIFVEILNPPLE